jgi:hypothetical protein
MGLDGGEKKNHENLRADTKTTVPLPEKPDGAAL